MAATSISSIKSHKNSMSLPCRSHPATLQITELLNKIKTTSAEATSAETICSCLSQMTTLYNCINNLLSTQTTQNMMSHEQNKKWVDDLVDESTNVLDICSNIRDMLSEIKDNSKDLYYSLRRRKGDSDVENSISKYNCFRKKMKKDVKELVAHLKQVGNMVTGFGSMDVDSDNHKLTAVIRAVVGVSEITILVLESLLMFISFPVSKTNRWSVLVSKLTHKGRVACENQQEQVFMNEQENIDVLLNVLCKCDSVSGMRNLQIAKCRLERLEAETESMENALECVFRCLLQTRVYLLNIISQ